MQLAEVGYYVPDQYVPAQLPRRVATISLHTSPLDQPGTGDAGGLNVYVVEVARQLADRGVEVEIFTRAVSRETPPTVELRPGVLVRNVVAGPFEELDKNALPAQICPFTFGVLRAEAAYPRGRYDLVHTHYWLSGQVGAAAARRWGVPLVHSMHTLGKVKNLLLASGDSAEPEARIRGESEVVAAADALVANTEDEAQQLVSLYGASPGRVKTVSPGVDLSLFRPEDRGFGAGAAGAAGRRGGAGVRRARSSRSRRRTWCWARPRRCCGCGPIWPAAWSSCSSVARAGPRWARRDGWTAWPTRLASPAASGQEPPCPHRELADWYRAATVVLVPSHSESFGLVALEAQACGTPVVAAGVGGLRTAVRDGVSGVLVDGHDPDEWARVLAGLVTSPDRLAGLSRGAVAHASAFGWAATADRLLGVYTGAMDAVGTAGAGTAGSAGSVAAAVSAGGAAAVVRA